MSKNKNTSNDGETPDVKRKSTRHSTRPIDKHGDYDGTDVGFTSTFDQDTQINTKLTKNNKKDVRPINKHGNYDGTDVGFTSNSLSDQTGED